MENKLYLIREIYDSLSYRLVDKVENFYMEDNSMLLGARRTGKSTMAFIEAIVQCSLNDGTSICIYTDAFSERIHFDMLIAFCEELGIEHSKDIHNRIIIFSNRSRIGFSSGASQYRGSRYDYIVADVHHMTEDDYLYIRRICIFNFKFIVGEQTDFVRTYIRTHPELSYTFTYEDLGVI